ncbi:MAG: hypothetical protein ACYSU7_13595 [Planctomycetota bacterium]
MRRPGLIATLLVVGLGAAVSGAHGQCPGFGDCCVGNGTPGCDNEICCVQVCADDPFCCDVVWDSQCGNVALETCGVCGAGCPGSGNCCEANGSPGCDGVFCCLQVCASDPFCCDTLWDATCAASAQGTCILCAIGCPGGGDCCVDNGTPACDDAECCEMVCSAQPFCCDGFWDGLCAEQAQILCDVCQPVCVDPFLDETATRVVPNDAYAGDQVTVEYRMTNVGECPTDVLLACAIRPVSGFEFITSPECEEIVLSVPGTTGDFSRCFNLPSALIPGLYEVCYEISEPGGVVFDEFCRNDLIVRTLGDLNGDGVVGLIDFLILLTEWGPCADCTNCPADFDGDCEVGSADFLILLANWG